MEPFAVQGAASSAAAVTAREETRTMVTMVED